MSLRTNGTLTDSTYISVNVMGNIYKTLFMGKVTTDTQYFPTIENWANNWVNKRQSYNASSQNTMVLSGLFYQYAKIDENALSQNKIRVSNNKYYDKYNNGVWQNPYKTKQTIAFTPPIHHYNKKQFSVILPHDLFLTNTNGLVQSIQVNFNDGAGYHSLSQQATATTNYAENGTYNWVFKVTLSTGETLYSQTKIKITAPDIKEATARTGENENDIVIHYPGSSSPFAQDGAVLRIDYAPNHNGQIKKPFIVVEGFDTGSITNPEEEGGDRTLEDFLNDLERSGDLREFLLYNSTQEYDIVYVDWQNGTHSIQHNSEVLKEVLAWVNQKKQLSGSTEPNVVLGQSMGGLVARYALKTMENDGELHDVRLFIAHDSPMRGANTPLSFQYFARHAYDEYTSAPILYGLVEYVIPSVLELADLMDIEIIDGSFPSVSGILTLQDTPAAAQMNYYYVDINSNPTTAVHDAWQQELDELGYPTQCRNVAISNGNECAADQGFNTGDKFISYHKVTNPGFWGDLVYIIANPLIGVLTNDIELTIIGILPGSSKYYYDLDLNANPSLEATNRKVYWGKIRYEKKLLWIAKISHTITNRTKNAPSGYLPFSTYSGGYYDIKSNISLPPFIEHSLVNERYGFIPVASALDIRKENGELTETDYLRKYAGGEISYPSLSTPFENFIVDFNKNNYTNNRHISFQKRNGDWLAEELNEETDITVYDCSAFCSNMGIAGDDSLCSTGTYSVTDRATTIVWTVTDPNNLVSYTINDNIITLTQLSENNRGFITLKVFYQNNTCGSATIEKEIWVGKPSFSFNTEAVGTNYLHIDMIGANGTDINTQGITSTSWQKVSSSGGCTASFNGSNFVGVGRGNCNNWVLNTKITATNSCGTTTVYKTLTPPAPDPCDDNYRIYNSSEDVYQIMRVVNPCDKTLQYHRFTQIPSKESTSMQVLDIYGNTLMETHQNQINVEFLNNGIYIIRAYIDGEVLTQKIIKQ